MFSLFSSREQSEQILAMIDEFEMFCRGEKFMAPDQFREINEEISVSAVMRIGKHRLDRSKDGAHLIWIAPDKSKHDLGPVNNLNIMRDCPGFHRSRSLLLGRDDVLETKLINVPSIKKNISVVKMKDGSIGYGPNYKIALRNAALKMHLKREFSRASLLSFWRSSHGNA
ncbi:MAG: hypothetical protein ACT4OY_07905 [Alphaproteobacteria bacterium]